MVTVFGDGLKQLTDELFKVMYDDDGIGLAAPQVGVNQRIMVMNEEGLPERKDLEFVMVNPVILAASAEKDEMNQEGCLSFPKARGWVRRHNWVEVEYQTLNGSKTQRRFERELAVIFQHEFDHLDKVLFIDRLEPVSRRKMQPRLDRWIAAFGPTAAP